MITRIVLLTAAIVLLFGSFVTADENKEQAREPFQYQEKYSCPPAYTDPNPVHWGAYGVDRMISVYFRGTNFDVHDVDLETIRVYGSIPPYDGPAVIEGDWIVTTCLVPRFLSWCRPITESYRGEFWVEFDLLNDEHVILEGHYDCEYTEAIEGDIDGDADVDCDDVHLLTWMLWWGNGQLLSMLDGDMDNDGDIDVVDLQMLIDVVGECPEMAGSGQ